MSAGEELSLAEIASRAGVSQATVRRWVRQGLVAEYEGRWTAVAAARVRNISRLRARGHTLAEIRAASESGRLAVTDLQDVLPNPEGRYALQDAARLTGLPPDVIQRIYGAMGLSALELQALSDSDLQMLRVGGTVLAAGLPMAALEQLLRVYSQAISQIADAEVRLVHLYVHEPLMRQGVRGVEIAEEMQTMVRELLPFIAPTLEYLHARLLAHFVEQDVIGHMDAELGNASAEEGRTRVTIAFADLAGYTRLTEERGDHAAMRAVERFLAAVERTLPADARVIKTLGDEAMVVGSDPTALTEWAVAFQGRRTAGEPPPRIGIHHGEALYRDGDYYGREVNQAARVAAHAAGGQVLLTGSVVEAVSSPSLRFRTIGDVRLKGFSEATELFLASGRRRTRRSGR